MHPHAHGPSGTIVPTLRYRDVATAIDWLCRAFGFERHLVVPGEDGTVHYAQLTFGDGMIMLGPVTQSAFDGLMKQPADMGGAETQICYLFVADAAGHCAKAKEAGAEIVLDIEEEGGRGYSCRDPEGHIWNFGTYDPWKRPAGQVDEPADEEEEAAPPPPGALRRWVRRTVVAMGVLIVMAATAVVADWASGMTGWRPWEAETQGADGAGANDVPATPTMAMREQLARAREAREVAEQAVKEAHGRLAQERSAREAAERMAKEAERTAQDAREQLARLGGEQGGKDGRERLAAAERAMAALRSELAAERTAREAADRAARLVREQVEREMSAKEEAERARQAREKAAKERAAKDAAAKEAADRTAKEAAERAAKEEAAKEAREKEAREKEARERKERAAAKRPAMRRVYSAPQNSSPPSINWFGG